MNIKSQKDFFAGLMFLLVGLAFAWGAGSYSIGTGARMGPRYCPMDLGVLLAVLGLIVAITALVICSALLLLSAFWHDVRAWLVQMLPEGIQTRLPVTQTAIPQPAS